VLLVSKVAIVLGAGGTLLLAINPPAMLAWLIWMGIGVMLATFAVPLLAGLYWRGATGQGAIASMVVGLVASGIFGYYSKFVGSLPVHFSLYALVLSAVAMVAVSLMTAKNSAEMLDSTRTGWFIQSPGQPSRKSSPGETLFVDQDTPRQQ